MSAILVALRYAVNAINAPHFDADRKYKIRDLAIIALAAAEDLGQQSDQSVKATRRCARVAMEWGFRKCEGGCNLERARIDFEKVLRGEV